MDKLFTVAEIAKKYGKHEETIRRWIREEKVIPVKRGAKGVYLVKDEDVKYLVDAEAKYTEDQNSILEYLHNLNVESSSVYNIDVGDEFTYKEFTEKINNRGVKGIRYRAGDSNVSIITTISGRHDNPYEDTFENGTLFYTGEGRKGSQELKFGNLRLYECQIQKTPVHVFQKLKDNHYVFLGLFKVVGYHMGNQPDDRGDIRSVFIFEMKPIIGESHSGSFSELWDKQRVKSNYYQHLINEAKNIDADLSKAKITKSSLTKRYKRSRKLVEILKKLYNYECQLCDPENPIPIIEMKDGKKYVEVHHIEGFSEVLGQNIEDQESGDFVVDHINNVICVCPVHHKMLHHYKSPIRFDANNQSFESQDGELELRIHKKFDWHKIGEPVQNE